MRNVRNSQFLNSLEQAERRAAWRKFRRLAFFVVLGGGCVGLVLDAWLR